MNIKLDFNPVETCISVNGISIFMAWSIYLSQKYKKKRVVCVSILRAKLPKEAIHNK